jgi:predicted  nucleic acid-binding Zn-ribbon protein
MKKLLQKWLGIDTKIQSLILEWNDSLERIRDLESQYHDLKYDIEGVEYTVNELEIRVDEIEAIDIENLKYDLKSETDSLKEEVNEVLTNFESMTEGYTVSVKLNPPS